MKPILYTNRYRYAILGSVMILLAAYCFDFYELLEGRTNLQQKIVVSQAQIAESNEKQGQDHSESVQTLTLETMMQLLLEHQLQLLNFKEKPSTYVGAILFHLVLTGDLRQVLLFLSYFSSQSNVVIKRFNYTVNPENQITQLTLRFYYLASSHSVSAPSAIKVGQLTYGAMVEEFMLQPTGEIKIIRMQLSPQSKTK